ncbi:hypothetical protein MNBD_ALPHA11-494, partial [hydrothermal vent metagenome]
MPFEVWTIYVVTVLAFMSTPGPSQLLILSNSAAHGFRRSLSTICGDLSANFFQMLAAGLGLAVILSTFANALTVIKWLGAIYLLWLGIRMIRNATSAKAKYYDAQKSSSLKSLWLQGFLTSAANPKAIVFFATLFPQFINPNLEFTTQFFILSATYIVIDGIFLSVYGMSS